MQIIRGEIVVQVNLKWTAMSMTIQEAKKKHEASILKMDGVISVGIGIRKDKTQAIIIGLRQENQEIIRKIPSELEGFPVEVQIIGPLSALH